MSVINNTPLGPGFSTANGVFDFERSNGNALANALAPSSRLGSDNVRVAPFGPSFSDGTGSGSGSGVPSGQSGIDTIFAAFLSGLSNMFSQLLSLMNAANAGLQPQPNSGQRAFSAATASSVGDPHESFNGTTGAGANVAGHWDSMASHQNLLSSDSFGGGYRIATVTQPNASGVTLNARADVATDGGNTVVGMKADGSYDVTSFGNHVDLVEGQATRLSSNETVTLNADKSLTIDERNAGGGSIATTLRSNASGGVDVSSSAHNVDLGGYLVSKNDADADPVALAASGGGFGRGFNNGIYPISAGPVVDAYATLPSSPSSFTQQPADAAFVAQPYDIAQA